MNNKMMNIYREAAMNSMMSENYRNRVLKHIDRLNHEEINIMLIGATGAGKSSTINALLGREIAKIGTGVQPETMDIRKYGVGNLIFWDTPGLGDGRYADQEHSKKIIDKLNELDKDGRPLIDAVLVVVDGSNRDMGTEYQVINEVIKPNIGKYSDGRIFVAINQADVAMKGRNWDADKNMPNAELESYLNNKAMSVGKRLAEATGIKTTPVYYAAGYKYPESAQEESYNISELFFYIMKNLRFTKRVLERKSTSADSLAIVNSYYKTAPRNTYDYTSVRKEYGNSENLLTLGDDLSYDDDDDDRYSGSSLSDLGYDLTMGFFNAVDSILGGCIDFLESLL